MVQILEENRKPSTSEKFGQAFAGLGQLGSAYLSQLGQQRSQQQQMQQQNQTIEKLTGMDPSGLSEKQREIVLGELLKQQGKNQRLGQTQGFLDKVFGGSQQKSNQMNQMAEMDQQQLGMSQGFDPSQLSDADIAQAAAMDPNLGRILQQQKDVSLREKRAQEKNQRSEFESERAFHTGFSKETEKEANELRRSLPKKEMALDFARNAVETGDMSYFSLDKLADVTGQDIFRTAKGAQLITAGKENLLSNMGRVSARAQNQWFEQRLNSMFPKVGQSREANLTVQEMLEGEAELDKAYLNSFDKIAAEDEDKYGFVRKDISKRVHQSLKPLEKEILQRTSYRMKEIEEQEKGLSSLKKQAGKNVSKGTPLTLAMAKIYKDKFGDNALQVAEKNGYHIPSIEEFKMFQARPQEHREQILQ